MEVLTGFFIYMIVLGGNTYPVCYDSKILEEFLNKYRITILFIRISELWP